MQPGVTLTDCARTVDDFANPFARIEGPNVPVIASNIL